MSSDKKRVQFRAPHRLIDRTDALAEVLRGLDSPDEAVFYTSGRTSNEAAFLYQLMARLYGTNNLPDCSNLCHESSGAALGEQIGTGKGTVPTAWRKTAPVIHRVSPTSIGML